MIDEISTHDDLKNYLDKPGFLLIKRRSQKATKIHVMSCHFVARGGATFVVPGKKHRQEIFWSDELGEVVMKLLEISICKLPEVPDRICMICKNHIPQDVIEAALLKARNDNPNE